MLKWNDEDGIERTLKVSVAASDRTDRCMVQRTLVCDPADIVRCLEANPEACAEVWEQLSMPPLALRAYGDMKARAERAEQVLATVTAERDEARALIADLRADLSRAQNVLAPEVGRALTAEEMAEEAVRLLARIREHEKRENALHSKGMQFRQERDALKARLAEAERQRDEARAERDVATKEEDRAKFSLAKAAEQIEALRAQLAKTERVVKDFAEYDCEYGDNCPAFGSRHGRCVGCKARAALRDLDAPDDSPVGAGTDSGGASGATAGPMGSYRGGRNPEAQGSADGTDPGGAHVQAPVTPAEPAGSCPCDCRLCASGHHVVCSRCLGRYADSPVGVAATAEDGHETRCTAECPGTGRRCIRQAGHDGLHVETDPRFLDGTLAPQAPQAPQAPATRAELDELRREVLTTLADALCEVHVPMPGSEGLATVPHGLRELADELRRRVERLERGPRRVG